MAYYVSNMCSNKNKKVEHFHPNIENNNSKLELCVSVKQQPLADDALSRGVSKFWLMFEKLGMAPKTPRTPQTPSKTTARVEWKQCSSCKSTYVLRDSLRHEAVCSVIAANDFSIADVNHGFISNKVFYPVFDDNGCKECFQLAVKLQRSQLMLVPPSAMQLAGIQIGSHVLVETHHSKLSIFMAWPCSHISPSSVHIDSDGKLSPIYLIHI